MEQLLWIIIFTILIVDAIKNVISMSTNKQEDEMETKVETHLENDIFVKLQIIILSIFALICIFKLYMSIRKMFGASLRQLWYSFVPWISSIFLCRCLLEVPIRQEVNETELSQNQEEICNPSNELENITTHI